MLREDKKKEKVFEGKKFKKKVDHNDEDEKDDEEFCLVFLSPYSASKSRCSISIASYGLYHLSNYIYYNCDTHKHSHRVHLFAVLSLIFLRLELNVLSLYTSGL